MKFTAEYEGCGLHFRSLFLPGPQELHLLNYTGQGCTRDNWHSAFQAELWKD